MRTWGRANVEIILLQVITMNRTLDVAKDDRDGKAGRAGKGQDSAG